MRQAAKDREVKHLRSLPAPLGVLLYHRAEKKAMAKDTPQARYEARALTQVKLKLHKKNDADILEALERSGNKQGYIKALIRADIAKKDR